MSLMENFKAAFLRCLLLIVEQIDEMKKRRQELLRESKISELTRTFQFDK